MLECGGKRMGNLITEGWIMLPCRKLSGRYTKEIEIPPLEKK